MSIRVVKAGILDTIQDEGRYGYQHQGINPAGAMDRFAMQVANILVGNPRDEAVFEMHFPASVFLFKEPALIAFSGAGCTALVNAEPVPSLRPLVVGRNDVLQFQAPKNGARIYLAIAGGIEAEEWLNSRSTHLKLKAGGHMGRALQKEDEIRFKKKVPFTVKQDGLIILPWEATVDWGDDTNGIAVIAGAEWDWLSPESKMLFTTGTFMITAHSDRMGYRLDHPPLRALASEELISSAVSFGTIQLLPDGKLLVLAADHPTTGGYPRVAHVIGAHHSRLAQLKAGDGIQFRPTSQGSAENLFVAQQQHLQQLQNACTFRLEKFYNESPHQL